MSLNSSLMQLSSGLAGYLAGIVITKMPDGKLMNYGTLGISTMFFSLMTILVATKIGRKGKSAV
jgi:predicted MFS family arabinose efflux permease